MKNYEDFMKEEERQDRLQENLEDKRKEEAAEADINWYRWQAEQRAKEYEEQCYEDDYFYDDFYPFLDDDSYPEGEYDPDCYSNPYPDDDDCDDDGFREFCSSAPEMEDHDLYPLIDELSKSIFLEGYDGAYATSERLAKKSVARNRHHAAEKAKKRAQQSATILASRYRNATIKTDYEEFRLYSKSSAAKKKATRVKTA